MMGWGFEFYVNASDTGHLVKSGPSILAEPWLHIESSACHVLQQVHYSRNAHNFMPLRDQGLDLSVKEEVDLFCCSFIELKGKRSHFSSLEISFFGQVNFSNSYGQAECMSTVAFGRKQ